MDFNKILKYTKAEKVLDIGAHHGEFYDSMCHIKPNFERYFAIEGNTYCESTLREKKIQEIFIGLVGKEDSNSKFYRRKGNLSCTGSSLYRELTSSFNDAEIYITEEKVTKLDSLFGENDVFDFIKIDTQGSELDILTGGDKVCKKATAILLEVSVLQYNEGAPLYDTVIEFMDKYGFRLAETIGTNTFPDGTIVQHDIIFIKK